jgi:hypothetical protein
VVADVAFHQFGCLDRITQDTLAAEFRSLPTGPREPVVLARSGTTTNRALTALWVFAQLPEEDRLGII